MANLNKEVRHTSDGKVDPSSLGGLYPVAKTFDQRAQDDRDRERRIIARQPRFVRFQMALYTSVLVSTVLAYILGVQVMWSTGSTPAIFFSFGIALVIVFSVIACLRYVAKCFYVFNRSVVLFIVAELSLIAGTLYFFTHLLGSTFTQFHSPLLTVTGAHFVALYIILFIVIRYDRS